ncbi:hypothetical protein AtNW77_Chr3g0196771 [Arabidopsis thaliana]
MYPRIFMDLPLEFSDIVPSESICKPSSASASSSSKGCESQTRTIEIVLRVSSKNESL